MPTQIPGLLSRRLARYRLRLCDDVMRLGECINLEELWKEVQILLEDATISRDLVSNARGLLIADSPAGRPDSAKP